MYFKQAGGVCHYPNLLGSLLHLSQAMAPKTQLIAHDKEVYDIAFACGKDIFGTVGADGSLRLFDLRRLGDPSWFLWLQTVDFPICPAGHWSTRRFSMSRPFWLRCFESSGTSRIPTTWPPYTQSPTRLSYWTLGPAGTIDLLPLQI